MHGQNHIKNSTINFDGTKNDSVLPTDCICVFRRFLGSTAAISLCGINMLAFVMDTERYL